MSVLPSGESTLDPGVVLPENIELLQEYEETMRAWLYSGFATPPAYAAIGRLFAELFKGDESAWQGFAATSAATIASVAFTKVIDELAFKRKLIELRARLIPTAHQADLELTQRLRKAYPLFAIDDVAGRIDPGSAEYFKMLTYGTPEYSNLLAILAIQERITRSPSNLIQNFAGITATAYYAVSQAENAESFMGKIFTGVFAGVQGYVLDPYILLGIESQKEKAS